MNHDSSRHLFITLLLAGLLLISGLEAAAHDCSHHNEIGHSCFLCHFQHNAAELPQGLVDETLEATPHIDLPVIDRDVANFCATPAAPRAPPHA